MQNNKQKTFDDLPQLFDSIKDCIVEHRKKSINYLDLCLIMDYIAVLEERVAELESEINNENK